MNSSASPRDRGRSLEAEGIASMGVRADINVFRMERLAPPRNWLSALSGRLRAFPERAPLLVSHDIRRNVVHLAS